MKEALIKRFLNPIFIAAIAGFVYQILNKYGIAPDLGLWQQGVDLLSYTLIGAGIYTTFEK